MIDKIFPSAAAALADVADGATVMIGGSYPLTGLACVSRVYTDLAVLDITPAGVQVVNLCDGLGARALQALTAVPLLFPENRS